LRRVRQRAFVFLDPNQIPRIDPAVACLASEIMSGLMQRGASFNLDAVKVKIEASRAAIAK
jgi:hypothetical protein